ncbi:Acyl-CoA synthetase family member 3, mitochondrial [Galdieria sulphuraria]|nr:Acyl-CoA synthetase family member 3, mitochondrial [Galdieria sulphuraria]
MQCWSSSFKYIISSGLKLIWKRSFWEKAQEYGSKTAIVSRKNNYSYHQLLRDAKQKALLLAGGKDLEQARVAVLVPPSYAYVSWQWAIWLSGGVFVPLSPSHPQEELEYFVRDAEATHIVVSAEFQDKLTQLAGEYCLPYLRVSPVDGSLLMGSERKKPNVDTIEFPVIDKKRNAMIIYTSGTTSRPKGVLYTHDMIEAQIKSLVEAWQWTSSDHILNVLPLHHVHGIVNVVCCALYSGATLEMMEKFQAQPVWERWMLNLIPQGSHISLFMAVPTIYHRLIQMYDAAPPGIQPLLSDAAKSLRLFLLRVISYWNVME